MRESLNKQLEKWTIVNRDAILNCNCVCDQLWLDDEATNTVSSPPQPLLLPDRALHHFHLHLLVLSCWNNVLRLRSRWQPSLLWLLVFLGTMRARSTWHFRGKTFTLPYVHCVHFFWCMFSPLEVCSSCVGCCTDVLRFAFETHLQAQLILLTKEKWPQSTTSTNFPSMM